MSDHALLEKYLGTRVPSEGEEIALSVGNYVMKDGILRSSALYSQTQSQTQHAYGYLWTHAVFDENAEKFQVAWFEEHFPQARARLETLVPVGSIVLDAGCGAGWSALSFFGDHLRVVDYIGVDISVAVERARDNFRRRGYKGEFLQDSIVMLPFAAGSFDFVFTPGVLHHTDDIMRSLHKLAQLLVPGGRMLFWVYRQQPPLRAFADRLIREHLLCLDDDHALKALTPLTKLGETLGRLKATIEIPEDIPYLGISRGTMDLQRFFYYYIVKTFYNEALPFERANMQNFDWYRPINAHTSTPEQIEKCCDEAGLAIEWQSASPSGISVIAKRTS